MVPHEHEAPNEPPDMRAYVEIGYWFWWVTNKARDERIALGGSFLPTAYKLDPDWLRNGRRA